MECIFCGLIQERCNSSALAVELRLSCINPLLCRYSRRKMILLYRELIQIMLKWRMTVYKLTHGGQDKMVTILQTTFSNRFSRMKMYEFQLKFHWSLFLRVKLTIYHHWFRYWLDPSQATNNYLKQWWLVNQCIYVWLGCNGLKLCHMKQKYISCVGPGKFQGNYSQYNACSCPGFLCWQIVNNLSLIAWFMGPTWGPSGADRTQVGPMLAPWTLLFGWYWLVCV